MIIIIHVVYLFSQILKHDLMLHCNLQNYVYIFLTQFPLHNVFLQNLLLLLKQCKNVAFCLGRKTYRAGFGSTIKLLFSFWGRDGPSDKTSGHKLLFSVLFFVLGWYELRFLSCYQIL